MKRLMLLGFAALACGRSAPVAVTEDASVAPSSATRWVRSRPAADAALLEGPARVLPSPDSVAAVAAPMRARVVRVRVKAGQQVARGEPLVDVMMPELVQAAGAFTAAQLKLEAHGKRRAQLEALKAEGLARGSELAELDATLASLKADAQAARATLRTAGLSDRQAASLLDSDGALSLKAPISGTVVSLDAVAGEVREPSGPALLELAQAARGQVEARLPGSFTPGAQFELIAGGRHLPLELVSVSPRLDPKDGARLLWLQPPEGTEGPAAGTTGRVRLIAKPGWRAVPAWAVSGSGDEAYVLVLRRSGPTPLKVTVIAQSGAEAIVDGLDPDAEVASDASQAGPGASR